MKVSVLIVEGGGDHRGADLAIDLRRAFSALQRSAGLEGRLVSVMAGGGRQRSYETFVHRWKTRKQDEVPLLLVDAEAVPTANSRWEHVKQREGDGWVCPNGASDEHLHFMTVMMETWLLADPKALQRVFGEHFKPTKLPKVELETMTKDKVKGTIKAVTGDTYSKGGNSFKVLAAVDATVLEAACPSAKSLFEALRAASP